MCVHCSLSGDGFTTMAAVPVARLLSPLEVVVGFLVDLGSVAATYEVMETLSPAERSRQLASFVDNIRLVTLRTVTALRDAGVTPMCRYVPRLVKACMLAAAASCLTVSRHQFRLFRQLQHATTVPTRAAAAL